MSRLHTEELYAQSLNRYITAMRNGWRALVPRHRAQPARSLPLKTLISAD